MDFLRPLIPQNLQEQTSKLWFALLGTTIKNYQGYQVTFAIQQKGLFCNIEKDNIIRNNVPVVILSDYVFSECLPLSARLITFDLFQRRIFIGERGLKGGGNSSSRNISRSESTEFKGTPLLVNHSDPLEEPTPLQIALKLLEQAGSAKILDFIKSKLIEEGFQQTEAPSSENETWKKENHEVIFLSQQIDAVKTDEVIKKIYLTSMEWEASLDKDFQESFNNGNVVDYLDKLCKLGEFYVNKENYIKAAHLFQNILGIYQIHGFEKEKCNEIIERLLGIELLFLQKKLGVAIDRFQENYAVLFRQQLSRIRDKIKMELLQKIPTETTQKNMTACYQELLQNLIENAFFLLGPPPTNEYAFIGFGSMAGEEMCPYSDIEYAILIKENTSENLTYFRKLSEFIELKIINLGETEHPIVPAKKVGQTWVRLPISFIPKGFSLDSAGLTPAGKKDLYELIGTPDYFANFQRQEWVEKNGAEVCVMNALSKCCFIMGSQFLVEDYRMLIRQTLDEESADSSKKLRQKRALDLLEVHLEEFKPWLESERIETRAFDVKRDLSRPIQMGIEALTLYYGIESKSTLKNIRELMKMNVFCSKGAEQLQKTFEIAMGLRIKAHQFYGCEKEILFYSKENANQDHEKLCTITPQLTEMLKELFRTLLPFHDALRGFVNGQEQMLYDNLFYDLKKIDDEIFKKNFYYNTQEIYIEYKRICSINPNDERTLAGLAKTSLLLYDLDNAFHHVENLLAILEKKFRLEESVNANILDEIAVCFYIFGVIYTFKSRAFPINRNKAIENFILAFAIYEHLGKNFTDFKKLNIGPKSVLLHTQTIPYLDEDNREDFSFLKMISSALGSGLIRTSMKLLILEKIEKDAEIFYLADTEYCTSCMERYLIKIQHSDDSNQILSISSMTGEINENTLNAQFEHSFNNGDIIQSISYLKDLAEFYLKKKEYKKAALYFQSVLAAMKINNFQEDNLNEIRKKVDEVEFCFLKDIGVITKEFEKSYHTIYKERLTIIREEIQKKIQDCTQPQEIQEMTSRLFQDLLLDLVGNAMFLLGETPPSNYAIICFDAMARKEMLPFSSLQFGFLLEKNDDQSNRDYFRKLSQFLELRIINLGETYHPIVKPRKVVNISINLMSFTPKGFSLDPDLSPLGRDGKYELIGTAEEFAQFQGPEFRWLRISSSDIPLAYSLRQFLFLGGENSLAEEYYEKLQVISDQQVDFTKKRLQESQAIDLLSSHVVELFNKKINLNHFDVKNDFYSPVQKIFGFLRLYHGIDTMSTLETLQELKKRKIFSQNADRFYKGIIIAIEWCIKAQLFYCSEKEILYNSSQFTQNSRYLLAYSTEESQMVSVLSDILIEIIDTIKNFVGNKDWQHLFEIDNEKKVQFFPKRKDTSNYCEILKQYEQIIIVDPNNEKVLDCLIKLYLQVGNYSKASIYVHRRLIILEKNLVSEFNRHGPETVSTLKNISLCIYILGTLYAFDHKEQESIHSYLLAFSLFDYVGINLKEFDKLELSPRELKQKQFLHENARLNDYLAMLSDQEYLKPEDLRLLSVLSEKFQEQARVSESIKDKAVLQHRRNTKKNEKAENYLVSIFEIFNSK